jgi:hypothetical protein
MRTQETHSSSTSQFEGDTGRNSTRNLLLTAIAGILVAIISAAATSFGTRAMTGGDTSIRLSAQVERILDDNKDQTKQLTDILSKVADLYTRREAQADREAFERRFQSIESRLTDVSRENADTRRALESVVANQRMQQIVIDKFVAARR